MRTFQPKIKSILSLLAITVMLCFAGKGFAQISTTTVTVNDSSSTMTPVAAASATPASYCTGGTTQLSVTGGHLGTGAAWTWYADACPSPTATPVGTGASLAVSPTNTGTATITKTYYVRAEGTCNTTACVPVTVTIYPTPTATAPANATYCNGTAIAATSLTGTPTGISYDISGGSAIGLPDATNQTQIPGFTATISGTAPVTSTITITPKANGCTGTPVTFTITVLPTATMNIPANQTKCDSANTDLVTFSTSTTGGTVTYSWTNNNTSIGLAASGTGGTIPAFQAINNTCADTTATITVTPTLTSGTNTCAGTPVSFTIKVHPRPNGTIAGGAYCQGSPINITYTATCGLSPYTIEYRESTASSNQSQSGVTNGAVITVTPQPTTAGNHTYNLMKVTDANGCTNPAQ